MPPPPLLLFTVSSSPTKLPELPPGRLLAAGSKRMHTIGTQFHHPRGCHSCPDNCCTW